MEYELKCYQLEQDNFKGQHPNADTLELLDINGFQAIVKIGQFKPGDKIIYVEPEYDI